MARNTRRKLLGMSVIPVDIGFVLFACLRIAALMEQAISVILGISKSFVFPLLYSLCEDIRQSVAYPHGRRSM